MRVPRVAGVRTSSTLGRYSSAIRAACANERSCGSARGAISNGRPYRDLIVPPPGLYVKRPGFDSYQTGAEISNISGGCHFRQENMISDHKAEPPVNVGTRLTGRPRIFSLAHRLAFS